MKLNEFICPCCQHRWFDECEYGTCSRCRTFFYLSATHPAAAQAFTTNVPQSGERTFYIWADAGREA